jgi:nitrogen fixation NifU-like protein
MYTEKTMEHFRNPRNVGEIQDADGVGMVGNASCGDIMEVFIKVDDDVITDCKFKTFGCGAAIASTSVLTEMVIGKTIDEALAITKGDIVEELGGLPNVKIHCSVLATEALSAAIAEYRCKKQGGCPEVGSRLMEHSQEETVGDN